MHRKDQLWDVLLEVDFRVLERDGCELQVRGEEVVILAHLHCLPSIVEFFRFLLTQDLAIPARQIVTIPKPYSTIASAAEEVKKLGVTLIQTSTELALSEFCVGVNRGLRRGRFVEL